MGKTGITVKNKFFMDKFVLTLKFAGVGSMEDYYKKWIDTGLRMWYFKKGHVTMPKTAGA